MDSSSESFFLRAEPATEFPRSAADAMAQHGNLEQSRCKGLFSRFRVGQRPVLQLGKWCELVRLGLCRGEDMPDRPASAHQRIGDQ